MLEAPPDPHEIARDFAALEQMHRVRMRFEMSICLASASQDEAKVLAHLRHENMFEFAEFFYTIAAMDLTGPDDIGILAREHNERVVRLSKDRAAMQRRGLTQERLTRAYITDDVLPRLEYIWRELPGALDQSNLARCLGTQMSPDTNRKLVVASEAAGFLTRQQHVAGAIVVRSTGVMERVLGECLREMRNNIARL